MTTGGIRIRQGWVAALAFLALGSTALAADSSTDMSDIPVSSVSANETGALPDVLDHFFVNYFGTYHGSPVTSPVSPYSLSSQGKPGTDAMNFDSEITTAYKITPDIGIGPDIPFVYVPVLGQGIIMGDLGIKAYDNHLISGGGFNLYMNFYLQAPTSAYSKLQGMKFAVKTEPNVRFQAPGSRIILGSWSEIKSYYGVSRGTAFKLYAEPYVGYEFNPKIALNLGYEMEAHHNVTATSFDDFTNYGTDLQPGFVWNITPKILINPYLQLFTGNSVTSETTAFGAVIYATLL